MTGRRCQKRRRSYESNLEHHGLCRDCYWGQHDTREAGERRQQTPKQASDSCLHPRLIHETIALAQPIGQPPKWTRTATAVTAASLEHLRVESRESR
jgi:hypothetical protein